MKNLILVRKIGLSFLLLCISVAVLGQSGKVPRIHLISIVDRWSERSDNYDKDYLLRRASELMHAEMSAKLNAISKEIKVMKGLAPSEEIFIEHRVFDDGYTTNPDSNKFSWQRLDNILNEIDCKGDIVFVLYNGHGFSFSDPIVDNRGNEMSYPDLILNYEGLDPLNPYSSMPYVDILCRLQRKQPSLIVSLVNACQNEVAPNLQKALTQTYETYQTKQYTTAGGNKGEPNKLEIREKNIRNLFLLEHSKYNQYKNNPNEILSAEFISCSKGEFTWIGDEGGHLYKNFSDVFDRLLEGQDSLTWEEIAKEVDSDTRDEIQDWNEKEDEIHLQNPQCRVFVKYLSCFSTPTPLNTPSRKPIYSGGTTGSNTNLIEYKDYLKGTKIPPFWLARNFVKLGSSYRIAGGIDESLKILNVARPVVEKQVSKKHRNNDKYLLASLYENTGLAHADNGDPSQAIEYLEKAKELYIETEAAGSVSVIDHLLEKLVKKMPK